MSHRKFPLPCHFNDIRPGICRWCNKPITKKLKNGKLSKSTWHKECVQIYKFYFWPSYTRKIVWRRDKGKCAKCHTICDKKGPNGWDLDHIVPLYQASGQTWAWDLENLQTLCKPCHKQKTALEATERSEARKRKKQ